MANAQCSIDRKPDRAPRVYRLDFYREASGLIARALAYRAAWRLALKHQAPAPLLAGLRQWMRDAALSAKKDAQLHAWQRFTRRNRW